MRRNPQLVFGLIIIGVGLAILLSAILDVSIFAICIPGGFILLGIWVLIRPKYSADDSEFRLRIFGDIRRRGVWTFEGEEIWLFIGDVRYDFTEAEVPSGETKLRVIAFIGDIRLKIPEGIGIRSTNIAFLNEVRFPGLRRDAFVVPVDYETEGYAETDRQILLETLCFIGEIRIAKP